MLKPEYQIAHFPKPLREDMRAYCRLARCTLEDVWYANKDSLSQMSKPHGMIRYLAAHGHSGYWIMKASNQPEEKVRKVIQLMRTHDFPIRTTNWEKFA